MDNTKEYIRHLSLCSGYEGIGLGLRRVLPDVREVAHVEIEAFAIANLVAKMEAGEVHPAPVFSNLKEFPFRKFRGCVDILSGGFPCQPFSGAGKRKGTEDPRHLFPYILEGIKECQPAVVFLENVEGIISSKTEDGESVLKHVLQSLEEVGYRATAGVFSAAEVGAPHQRKRVFIMAHRKDFRCGGWQDQDRVDGQRVQKFEGEEQSMVRGKTEGCSGDIRELGNSEHDGLDATKIGGCTEEASKYNSQGAYETSKLEGAGKPQGHGDICGGEPEEVADPNNKGLEGRRDCSPIQTESIQANAGAEGSSREQGEVADPDSERLEGGILRGGVSPEGREEQGRSAARQGESRGAWPARPREEQHEWEEPRVVGNPISKRLQGTPREEQPAEKDHQTGIQSEQVEPFMGRATDGTTNRVDPTANRVDRLRLLGNGVVPCTASKAFIELSRRLV